MQLQGCVRVDGDGDMCTYVCQIINRSLAGEEVSQGWPNCTITFESNDLNHNGYMGMHETIKFLGATGSLGLDTYRANQINCEVCIVDTDLYYL